MQVAISRAADRSETTEKEVESRAGDWAEKKDIIDTQGRVKGSFVACMMKRLAHMAVSLKRLGYQLVYF